jgi:hypothetical protein
MAKSIRAMRAGRKAFSIDTIIHARASTNSRNLRRRGRKYINKVPGR